MKIYSCKAKGRRLAQYVKDTIMLKAKDVTEFDINVVPSSVPGEDLWLSPQVRKQLPFTIECKNTETASVWSWIRQTENRVSNLIPLIVFSRNRSKVYALIEFEKLLDVILTRGDNHASKTKTCDETAKAKASDA